MTFQYERELTIENLVNDYKLGPQPANHQGDLRVELERWVDKD